jgi:hypothetical protein
MAVVVWAETAPVVRVDVKLHRPMLHGVFCNGCDEIGYTSWPLQGRLCVCRHSRTVRGRVNLQRMRCRHNLELSLDTGAILGLFVPRTAIERQLVAELLKQGRERLAHLEETQSA